MQNSKAGLVCIVDVCSFGSVVKGLADVQADLWYARKRFVIIVTTANLAFIG